MFNASMDPDDPAFEQEEEPLQDAELYLLSKIDYGGSSPHMFFVSGGGQDGGPGSGNLDKMMLGGDNPPRIPPILEPVT
jgi:hypothetical protein